MAERKVVTDNQLAALATDAEVATAVSDHSADTTSVHGITDMSALATSASVTSAVSAHEADTTSVHGIANTAVLATASSVATAVSNHEADTTAVHGIADTSALLTTSAAAAAYQPLDSDLTAIAALTTTTAGRALLDDADASAQLTTLGVSTFVKTVLDDTDAATARATLGVQTPWKAGRYYAPVMNTAAAGLSLPLNRLEMTPLYVPGTVTIDRIGFQVTVADAAGLGRLLIYNDSGSNAPTGAPVLDAGTVSAATTGIKEITVSQQLTQGQYWLGLHIEGATYSVMRQSMNYGHATGGTLTAAETMLVVITGHYIDNATYNPLPSTSVFAGAMSRVFVRAA